LINKDKCLLQEWLFLQVDIQVVHLEVVGMLSKDRGQFAVTQRLFTRVFSDEITNSFKSPLVAR
jgi:hypothetical protein